MSEPAFRLQCAVFQTDYLVGGTRRNVTYANGADVSMMLGVRPRNPSTSKALLAVPRTE